MGVTCIFDDMNGFLFSSDIKSFLMIGIALFLIAFPLGAALSPPAELHLNTVVEPVSEFLFSEASPVSIIPGTTQRIGFLLKGNFLIDLKISGSNYGDGTFRMKHTEENYYIPYNLSFDYGNGMLTPVTHNLTVPLTGYTIQEGYNINSFLEISSESVEVPEGAYVDTITFSVISQ